MAGSANLNVMMKTARKVGRALLKDFTEVEQLQVSAKGPGDFVSRADINDLQDPLGGGEVRDVKEIMDLAGGAGALRVRPAHGGDLRGPRAHRHHLPDPRRALRRPRS